MNVTEKVFEPFILKEKYYLDQDSDDDLLIDSAEVKQYATDPKNPDTDGDGFTDYLEIISGTDPLDSSSIPGYAHLFIAVFLIIVCYGSTIILFWDQKKISHKSVSQPFKDNKNLGKVIRNIGYQ